MDAQNYWFSSGAAGGGGDPGDPIGQSLRFGAGRVLTRTAAVMQTSWTASWWFKYAIAGAQSSERIMCANGSSSSYLRIGTFTTPSNQLGFPGSVSGSNFGPALRDPSAWYHIVVQCTGTGTIIWLNGEQIGTGSSLGTQDLFTRIGSNQNPNAFEGLMADWYLIDGQALEPTEFGRYNNDDVWVPVDYDGTAADYGAGGFHLTFEDPDDLGADTAPIGATGHTAANNYTPTGFNTDPVGIFSDQLVSSSGTWVAGRTPTQLFGDTNTATMAQVGATGATMTFTPTTPINYQSLHYFNHGATWDLNNGTTGGTTGAGGWQTIDANPGTLTSLEFLNPPAAAAVGAIAINGTAAANILVDNDGVDYDSMQDSPTQNYETLNPLTPTTGALSRANLTLTGNTGSNWSLKDSTLYLNGGRAYWEVQCITRVQTIFGVGQRESFDANRFSTFPGQSGNGQSTGLDDDGGLRSDGTITNNWSAALAAGDIVSFALDLDAGALWIGINGTWQNGATQAEIEAGTTTNAARTGMQGTWRPVNTATTGAFDANYGQKPFVHTVPTGFEPLQTQNLPEITIANGRDHFRVITGPGEGPAAGDPNTLAGPWSKYFVRQSDPTSQAGITNIPQGFNNQTGNNLSFGANQHSMFAPTGDDVIDFTTSIEVWLNGPAGVPWGWFDNGLGNATTTPQSATTGAWTQIGVGPGQISLDRPIGGGAIGTGATLAGIRVDGNVLVDQGILPQAQSVFPNGLWWIKSFNANNVEGPTGQHQLCDNTRTVTNADGAIGYPWDGLADITTGATHAYTAPPGPCLAWCWSAPDAWNDASINNNTGFRNQTAGFSMFQYEGNGNGGHEVAHGLTEAPQFFMIQCLDNSAGFAPRSALYHHLLGPGGSANNTVLPATNPNIQYTLAIEQGNTVRGPDIDFWNDTAPDATNITLGDNDQTNANNITYQCYAWHSVPGYSQFGRYAANNATQATTADGPFIYTGFTPAAIWVKGIGQAETWSMRDSTRNPNNPVTSNLATNQAAGVTTSTFEVDFLSNGFKIRNGDGVWNFNNSAPYVYACWATNPFGGENTVPVTAR